jgi:hypothetical protein
MASIRAAVWRGGILTSRRGENRRPLDKAGCTDTVTFDRKLHGAAGFFLLA